MVLNAIALLELTNLAAPGRVSSSRDTAPTMMAA